MDMRGKPERQAVFEALLREHRGIVSKVARIYANDRQDVEDLGQEIAVQLWRSFGRYDERRAKFTTWMYRVALNVAISWARSARRHGAGHLEPLDDAHLSAVAGPDDPQREAVDRDERIALLASFIALLDPLSRALVLLYLEERSHAEIAEVLGISETNVATKLNRIKHKLRTQAPACPPLEDQHGTRRDERGVGGDESAPGRHRGAAARRAP
jgi:RNA polymerase sigma-70 factor (ECF subfamily)